MGVKELLYLIGGVVIGSVATYFVLKGKMDEQIEQEIEDVKAAYKKAYEDSKDESDHSKNKELAELNEKRKADLITSSNIINKQQYNLFSKPPKARDIHNGIDEDEDLDIDIDPGPPSEGELRDPYTITPEEFVNDRKEFDKVTLMHYSDGIVIEEMTQERVPDINYVLGKENLKKIGEYEEGVAYIRNERLGVDYEVIDNDVTYVSLYGDGLP